jgi:hypothetical protein
MGILHLINVPWNISGDGKGGFFPKFPTTGELFKYLYNFPTLVGVGGGGRMLKSLPLPLFPTDTILCPP